MGYIRSSMIISRKDLIRNEVTKEQINTRTFSEDIERKELIWFGHLRRMGGGR